MKYVLLTLCAMLTLGLSAQSEYITTYHENGSIAALYSVQGDMVKADFYYDNGKWVGENWEEQSNRAFKADVYSMGTMLYSYLTRHSKVAGLCAVECRLSRKKEQECYARCQSSFSA